MRESLRFTGKILSATVSRVADRWCVAIAVAACTPVSAVSAVTRCINSRQSTRRFHTIGIEDLNLKGMMKNRHLSRSIADMGFFEFRRQLEYKAAMRGGEIVVADRFFASSLSRWLTVLVSSM